MLANVVEQSCVQNDNNALERQPRVDISYSGLDGRNDS